MRAQPNVWAVSAVALAMAAGTAACNRTASDEAPAQVSAPEQRDQSATQGDTWITTSVRSRYFADNSVKGRDIDVSTQDGVVTLTGTVDSDAERTQAIRIAEGVDGVKRVDAQLQVRGAEARQQPAAQTAEKALGTLDAGWITTKIQAQYFADDHVKPWNVDVDTARTGVVTLRGDVDSEQARQAAVRIARSTEGVREVKDELRIVREGAQGAESQTATTFTDPWITAKVQSKYFLDDEVKGSDINVDTQAGVVTLKGQVQSASARRQALAIARSTDGVKNVLDQLTVQGEAVQGEAGAVAAGATREAKETGRDVAEAVDDTWITTKIQSKFFIDQDVRAQDVEVSTSNGVVTLKGRVSSEEMRRTINDIAKETRGVKKVVDQLTIGPDTDATQ